MTPTNKWWVLDCAGLWRQRHILKSLTWRNIAVRYKQTYAGVLWVLLQPFIEMLVFTLVFHRFVGIAVSGFPYQIFVYMGLLPWTYFSASVSHMTVSIVGGKGLITRMAFPRIYLPLSEALSKLVDLLASFSILFLLLWVFAVPVGWEILWMIPLLVLTMLSAFAVGLWFSALHAIFRDVGLVVPYLLRVAMFLTPVIYPVTIVSPEWRWLLHANPLTGIIEGFRAAVLQTTMPVSALLQGTIVIAIVGVTGLLFFQKLEYRFIDEI